MRKLPSCVVVFAAACGGGGGKTPDAAASIDAPVETLGPAPALAIACTDAMADVYTLPSGLPAMSDAHRGDVFRCSTTESLSAYKVNAQIAAYDVGYPLAATPTEPSGFWTYRIAYRTERNTVNSARAEGETAAFLLVPEKPLAGAPLIVFGHGTAGVAAKCAPSLQSLAAPVIDHDFVPALLRLAGAGYTVIAPDFAGFAYGQPPGYFNAEDEAHAILDATRAAANVLPTPPTKVAFVGHSQGGHAVVAAQAYASAYGHAGTLVGVAALAPVWNSLDAFAAATTPSAGFMTSTDVVAISFAMQYAYSAGELYGGAGHGVDVFATAKQQAAKDAMFTGDCFDAALVQGLGATPSDFFDSTYVNNVGGCALGGACSDSLSTEWMARWLADRPALDPAGAPLLVVFGGKDAIVTPPRQQCAIDRFTANLGSGATATVKYCNDPDAGHDDLVRTTDVDTVLQWIASQAGLGTAPSCTAAGQHMCPPLPVDY